MKTLVPDENFNCRAEYQDGSTVAVYANQLHNKQLDQWQGWHCQAGVTRIYVDHKGDVWSCEGRNIRLGNVYSDWQHLAAPGQCSKPRCGPCTDDLVTEKYEK